MVVRFIIACAVLAESVALAALPLPEHVKPDGPQQAVIYSEHTGSADVGMGDAMVKTCQGMCASKVFPQPCRIEGNAQRHGEYVRRTWRTANASTNYTETWALLPSEPGDICTMRLQLMRTLRIETSDGRESTLLSIDLERGEGTRRVVKRRSVADGDPERALQALLATGYQRAGTGRYAGYACRLLRRTAGELVQEACLLEDSAAPASALGVPVQHMTLAHSMVNPAHPEARTHGETHLLTFNASVPAAVFTPPTNIRWKNLK